VLTSQTNKKTAKITVVGLINTYMQCSTCGMDFGKERNLAIANRAQVHECQG